MRRKRKFLIGGGIMVLAIAALLFNGLRNSTMYWYTPAELKAQGAAAYDKNLRVAGKVDVGSLQQDKVTLVAQFTITYQGESLPIYYQGVLPSGFKEDMDVTIDGRMSSSGVFQASQVLTKCPSKYVPEPSKNKDEGA